MYSVVIIDDEQKIVKLIERLVEWDKLDLRLAGTANNGPQAIDLIEEKKPQIAIMDIRMPGFSGLEAIRRIKERLKSIHFVIVSGYRHFDYAHSAIRYGVEDYLLKPVQQDELNQTLKKIVSELDELNLISQPPDSFAAGYLQLLVETESMSGQTAREMSESLGRKFPAPLFEVLLIKHDLNSREINPGQINLLADKTLSAVQSSFSDSGIRSVTYSNREGVFVLLNRSDQEEEMCRNILGRILESSQYLQDLFFNMETSVVRSRPFRDLSEISSAIASVRLGIHERILRGTGRIIQARDEASPSLPFPLLPQTKESLERAAEVLDTALLDLSWQEAVNGMTSNSGMTGHDIFQSCLAAVRLVKETIGTHFDCGERQPESLSSFEETAAMQGHVTELYDYTLQTMQSLVRWQREVQQKREDRPIAEAKDFIRANFYNSITLEMVSQNLGLNPSYFSSLFKRKTGMGFLEYLTHVRIEEAKTLLTNPKRSITDTAGEVGYRDTKHFAKQFKKLVGISPTDYRKIYG